MKKTQTLLMVMNILAWVTCFGLIAKAGAILISFVVSLFHPIASRNLYLGWNLSTVRELSFGHYISSIILMVAIILLEAWTAYLVTKALTKVKISKPFTVEVSNVLEQISYFILSIWVVAMIYNLYTIWLSNQVPGVQKNLFSGEFIFMAGVIFVFAQIFKRGVEIQSENELTV